MYKTGIWFHKTISFFEFLGLRRAATVDAAFSGAAAVQSSRRCRSAPAAMLVPPHNPNQAFCGTMASKPVSTIMSLPVLPPQTVLPPQRLHYDGPLPHDLPTTTASGAVLPLPPKHNGQFPIPLIASCKPCPHHLHLLLRSRLRLHLSLHLHLHLRL